MDEIIKLSINFKISNLFITFLVIVIGLLFGKLKVKNVGFGSSGVLIIAMIAGYLYNIPSSQELQHLGIVLFLLAVGSEAGPSFFRSFKKQGKIFISMVFVLLLTAGITMIAGLLITGIPVDLGLGLFAGAFTSTPALVSATQFANKNHVVMGYGIAYPFGLLTAIIFIHASLKIFQKRMIEEGDKKSIIYTSIHKIENAEFDKKQIKDISLFSDNEVIVSAIKRDNNIMAVNSTTILLLGDLLRLEGKKDAVNEVGSIFGKRIEEMFTAGGGDLDTRSIVVENLSVINKSFKELQIRMKYNASITKVIRSGFEIYPKSDLTLEYDDIVEAVGSPYQLDQLELYLGHKHHTVQPKVDILSITVMLFFSFLVGGIFFPIPFLGDFSLGLAGGALITGLTFGHFGRIGRFIGRFPMESTRTLKELGLAMFFVQVGIRTGHSIVNGINYNTIYYILFAVTLSLIPMTISFYYGNRFLKLSLVECFGVICGGMTFTAGLDIIREVDSSDKPVIAYSSVYPISLILVIFLVQGINVIMKMVS
ncbi:MAG: hypothetical protein H7A25_08070 [Leptospiraceae bacterium]|nr:hypothetical protein [Leptospiraceae bacterium]MCP5499842.1 hypothetical protein [Leptospiraceae bacterium]